MGALEDFATARDAVDAGAALLAKFADGIPHGALTDDERLGLTIVRHAASVARAAANMPGVDSPEAEIATEMLATLAGIAPAIAAALASLRTVRARVERGSLSIGPGVPVKIAGLP
jgi:hypothetical protein